MLPALILTLAALAAALLRLLAYRGQLLEMARILEETPAASNLRLTVRMSGAAPRRLCRAINARLEAGRQLRMETMREERELTLLSDLYSTAYDMTYEAAPLTITSLTPLCKRGFIAAAASPAGAFRDSTAVPSQSKNTAL